jgi:hypothetical protein
VGVVSLGRAASNVIAGKENQMASADKGDPDQTLKEVLARLATVNATVAKLDPAIKSDAFALLKPYVLGSAKAPRGKPDEDAAEDETHFDSADDDALREFLATHESDKPADNARAIAAFLYAKYGTAPFTTREIKEAADDAGVTVPARVDAMLNGAARDGKKIFQKSGRAFKVSVAGEGILKDMYGVRKGREKRPEQ